MRGWQRLLAVGGITLLALLIGGIHSHDGPLWMIATVAAWCLAIGCLVTTRSWRAGINRDLEAARR